MSCLIACGSQNADVASETDEAALSTSPHHGIWVYNPAQWISVPAKVDAFGTFVKTHGINEVYLSTNFALLENPALAPFIKKMRAQGVIVEALIGKVEWANAAGRPDMIAQLKRISSYNAAQTSTGRYTSVHLDIEPWMGTGDDLRWVVPLTNSYIAAKSALASSGLKLTVDLAGSKISRADRPQRQAMIDSVDKVVLMQYETALADALMRTRRFLTGLSLAADEGVVVAIRVVDFDATRHFSEVTAEIDGSFAPNVGYRGWAVYHYADALAASL